MTQQNERAEVAKVSHDENTERFLLRSLVGGRYIIEHDVLDLNVLIWQRKDVYGPFENREDARQFMIHRKDPDLLAVAREHDPNDPRFQ